MKPMRKKDGEFKTMDDNWGKTKDAITWLFFVMFFMILFAALHSCNPVKIAARKDVAAVDRVKGSRNLINQIAPIVNDLFPQPKDTLRIQGKPIIIKGKDSAYPVLIPFNIYTSKGKILDTLLRGVYIKIDTLGNIKIKLPSSDTSRIHDTIQLPADTRSKAIDGQTIANLNNLLSAASQSSIDADKNLKIKNKSIFWLIFTVVALSLVLLFLVYLLVNPKLKI